MTLPSPRQFKGTKLCIFCVRRLYHTNKGKIEKWSPTCTEFMHKSLTGAAKGKQYRAMSERGGWEEKKPERFTRGEKIEPFS